MPEKLVNLLDYDHASLRDHFATLGQKPFRATQIIKWIHQMGVTNFDDMTNLSKDLREALKTTCHIKAPEIALEKVSTDGTVKWLMRMNCGNCVETVFIPEFSPIENDYPSKQNQARNNNKPYNKQQKTSSSNKTSTDDLDELEDFEETSNKHAKHIYVINKQKVTLKRGTLCVSSQIGCALNCTFCSTGAQGFNRNLSTGEIIGQVFMARERLNALNAGKVTNVVMMGMGEPLLNFDNVVKAMNLMLDDNAYGLSKYRVTLSTSGVVPALLDLAECSNVALAISLHAPFDELRNELVPINKKYPLKVLLDACHQYFIKEPKRHITMEYVMLDGINDQPEHALALIKLLKGIKCKINLIPFNPFPNTKYKRSPATRIDAFARQLMKAGMVTMTRRTRGDDIDAACGQLTGDFNDRTSRSRLIKAKVEREKA